MRHFVARAGMNGVTFVYQTEVNRIEQKASDRYEIQVVYPDGATDIFTTARLINASGLAADQIAAAMGIDIDQRRYRQHYWKGEYFSIQGSVDRLNHLVYPVPEPQMTGLGVHATIDLSGRIKLGPNAVYLPNREIDYTVDPDGRDGFFEAAQVYLPTIKREDLAPEMAGIRPKLQLPGDPVRDFVIEEESDVGLPGVVNLVGIESPGLTSCMAIAKYVDDLIG
jgi:L-2-hydroxyglutarate oxidase LhgO